MKISRRLFMNSSGRQSVSVNRIFHKINYSRGWFFGILIIGALFAFELFNYSTTEYALNDLLGGLRFLDAPTIHASPSASISLVLPGYSHPNKVKMNLKKCGTFLVPGCWLPQ
jgi:hypothetical protein